VQENEQLYLMELKAKNKTVAYDKLKMRVNKKDILVNKVECYTETGLLVKTLEFKQLKDFGENFVRPSVIETYSPLYAGYRSLMIFESIKTRDFPDEVFTLNNLSKLEKLR
jgi:hypothetical protein